MNAPYYRVLVIEDDAATRRLIATLLQRHDFIVDTAVDGLQAIDMLARNDYDAILLDLMMPRVDGYGVLGYLRGTDIERLRSVIVLTSLTDDNVFPEPVWTVLTKPFDVDLLLDETLSCALGIEPKLVVNQ
jgi:CheY-like chemotaxis protein